MTKVTTGRAGAVRIVPLKLNDLALAEKHGKRLDETSKSRIVYPDAPPLTTTGLNLKALYKQHVAGVFVPKNNTKALHVIVQFPTQLVDGDDAEYMLQHARGYVEKVFGKRAIFADRVDRDEQGRHVVDLFVAPIYPKVTKHTVKDALGLSVHTKALANKHYPPEERPKKKDGKPRDINVYDIGRALQDELIDYLQNDMGLTEAVRGEPKLAPGPDWKAAEQLALDNIRAKEAEAEAKRQLAEQLWSEAESAKAAARKLEDEAIAERLRQEQLRAALQTALAKVQQDQAELQLRLAEADEEKEKAKLVKADAEEALQRLGSEREQLEAQQQQLGTAVGLLARGLDERNGLKLRPDPYVKRGFAVEEDKLRVDEAQIYRKWPAPLQNLGILVAQAVQKMRALHDWLKGREKEADRREAELHAREENFGERSAKLANEERALQDKANQAAATMEIARRESDRTQQELALHADWSRMLTDVAAGRLQLAADRNGNWSVVPGNDPVPARLEQRLQEPRPAWAEAALKTMKALEDGADALAMKELEVVKLQAKLTDVVAMADKAFTVPQKAAVEAATKALAQDEQRVARDAAQRGSGQGW